MQRRDFIQLLGAIGLTTAVVGPASGKDEIVEVVYGRGNVDLPHGAEKPRFDYDHYLVLNMNEIKQIRSEIGGKDNKEWTIEFYCDKVEEAARIATHLVDHMPYVRRLPAKVIFPPDLNKSARASIDNISIRQAPHRLPDNEGPAPMLIKFTLHYEGKWDAVG